MSSRIESVDLEDVTVDIFTQEDRDPDHERVFYAVGLGLLDFKPTGDEALELLYAKGYGASAGCSCQHDCCGHWFHSGERFLVFTSDGDYLFERSYSRNV
jgi:hypothetical protein